MNRILLLGAGNVGKAIAHDLRNMELTIADAGKETLSDVERYGDTVTLEVRRTDELTNVIKGVDVIVCALPGRFGYDILKAAIKCGTHVVDVSFMPEDPLSLDVMAKNAGVSLVVDAGFAPGLPNLFIGKVNSEMDSMDRCIMRVAGLPKNPEPPLFHSVTWSPEDLIEEYTRIARVVRGGMVADLKPLGEIRPVEVMGMELEEFYSDGLRTLLDTVKIHNMEETTMRWPGHLKKIKVLDELGFFAPERIPETLKVILPHMSGEGKDLSVLEVEIEGIKDGKEARACFSLYDEAREGFSSMSRVTGFTTALVTEYLAREDVPVGVLPLELLGDNTEFYDHVIKGLIRRGVKIKIELQF